MIELIKKHPQININETNLKKNIVVFLLIFFYIYSIEFSFIPIQTSQFVSLIGVFSFALIAAYKPYSLRITQPIIFLYILLFFYFTWVSFRTSMTGFQDSTLLINSILIILALTIGGQFIANILISKNYDFISVVRLFHMIIVIQAIFIIISFISVDFRTFTAGIIENTGNIDALDPLRVRGLTGGSGAKLSLIQGIGILFTIYLMYMRNDAKHFLYYLVSILILILSIMLTGRTGFLILFPILAFIIFCTILRRGINFKLVLGIFILPLVFYIGFQLFRAGYNLTASFQMAWGEDGLDNIIRRIQTEFFIGDGDSSFSTLSVLINQHIFFPQDVVTFLFGDPKTFSLYRIGSDVGFIRRIFGLGLIGLLLTYLLYIYIMVVIIKHLKRLEDKLLIACLMIFLLFTELKEPFIFDQYFMAMYSVLFYFVLKGKIGEIK